MEKQLLGHGDKFPYGEKFGDCLLCGRDIKDAKFFVNVTFDGNIWAASNGNCPESLDQGWFPIGSDCAKKFQAGVLEGVAA